MASIKYYILLLVFPLLAFTTVHKYYVSVTQVDYIEEQKTVQITTRVFIDDIEHLLRERYSDSITLNLNEEQKDIDGYIETYLKSKFKIAINGAPVDYVFLGKDYDDDIMQCFIEIENVTHISSFKITNTVLFDLFEDQKNVVRTNMNSKRKSFILIPNNDTGTLKF